MTSTTTAATPSTSLLVLQGTPVPRDFSRDMTFSFPLIGRGHYAPAFTPIVNVHCRGALILLPDDLRTALRDAGVANAPEVLPDIRISIQVPRRVILSPGATLPEAGGVPPFATAQDLRRMFPSLWSNADLAQALHQCLPANGDGVVEPRVVAYATPYEGVAASDVSWARMYLPLRTLIRASARTGQVFAHGQGWCMFPSVPTPVDQGTPIYVPTGELLVGLCTALRRTPNKEPTGHEWLAAISPRMTMDQAGKRITRSLVDSLFAQLFLPDLNDLTWEQEGRKRRRGPLLQMIVSALKEGSDVYEKLVVADGDPDEDGSEASQDELRRRIPKVRLCDHCKWPLRKLDSNYCIECGAQQKSRPLGLNLTAALRHVPPAEPAKVGRTGAPCPHDPSHNLRKPESQFCDLCNKPVEVASPTKDDPPQPPVVEKSGETPSWRWCTTLRGYKTAPDAQGIRCPLYHQPLFIERPKCPTCERELKGPRDKEKATFEAAKQASVTALGHDPEERYLASLAAKQSADPLKADEVKTASDPVPTT